MVRSPYSLREKLDWYRPLGFEGVQFHDDDAVENINDYSPQQIADKARQVGQALKDRGLTAEFVAPRLWFDPHTIDGGYTSNNAADRQYALDRTMRCIDVARALDSRNIVLWLAREGTYVREAKSARMAYDRLLEAINKMLAYDKEINIWIEPKPNEPMDHAYVPTIGHAIALAYASADPQRVSGLIETAHAILAGLDPSDEMAFALAHGKLASVHLNDQNGLKYDQDKNFGTANLRSAYNQVRVLEENGYGRRGEFVGLDVKVMRTQKQDKSTAHLANSREIFLHLVDKVRSRDTKLEQQYVEARDYEGLEAYTLRHLMGLGS
ncbi:MAG: TIM barrel protein [Pirellulales bacterium]|nr:TIM barrel protein [Pirellulales bacterium]